MRRMIKYFVMIYSMRGGRTERDDDEDDDDDLGWDDEGEVMMRMWMMR